MSSQTSYDTGDGKEPLLRGIIIVIDDSYTIQTIEKINYTPTSDTYQTGFWSAQLEDINDDGEQELVLGGFNKNLDTQDTDAVLAAYSYDGSTPTELNKTLWDESTDDGRTEVLALDVVDMNEVSGKQIFTGGIVGYQDAMLRRWSYNDTDGFVFGDNLDTKFQENEYPDHDRDRIFCIDKCVPYDGSDEKIITTGTVKTPYTNEHGHYILAGTIIVWSLDSSGNIQQDERFQYRVDKDNELVTNPDVDKGDLTEIFSLETADVDGDGYDEILTGGNFYNYSILADVSEVRYWDYDGTDIIYNDRVKTAHDGHSTVLSLFYDDVDTDFESDIVGIGFAHTDGEDKGFMETISYDSSNDNINKLDNSYWTLENHPVRDGEFFDNFAVYENDSGLKEVISSGRYGLTSPNGTFARFLEYGGLNVSLGEEENDKNPIEGVRYRFNSEKDIDDFYCSASGTDTGVYNYLDFYTYQNGSIVDIEWEQTADSSTTSFEYEIQTKNANEKYELIKDGEKHELLESDSTGLVTFTVEPNTTLQLTNMIISGNVTLNDVNVTDAKIFCVKRKDMSYQGEDYTNSDGEYSIEVDEDGTVYFVSAVYYDENGDVVRYGRTKGIDFSAG